ncbi:MAG: hypothetical protein NTY19_09085 [Planctomycetota bacterium]|nr:hypothetical protein [Planctomycetota bacterium]
MSSAIITPAGKPGKVFAPDQTASRQPSRVPAATCNTQPGPDARPVPVLPNDAPASSFACPKHTKAQGSPPSAAKLHRTTFTTSRLLDFASEKELTAQTGHAREDWPLVILKEAIDNALDACEEASVQPEVTVVVDDDGIIIADNGPGLPADTVTNIIDFSVRVSSREAYVSPTRGAQGNALKAILAIPYVLDSSCGQVEITAQGQRHVIMFRADKVRQEPIISYHPEPAQDASGGTILRVPWPESARSLLAKSKPRFLSLARDYTFLNPHLTLVLEWFGEPSIHLRATRSDWVKWLPDDPTSPHWYRQEELERLIAAYISHDQKRGADQSVREFITGFCGLTGTAKQKAVLAETGLARTHLSALVNNDNHDFDHEIIARLLAAMQQHTKLVKPAALGSIGKDHIAARFKSLGCRMKSFKYRRQPAVDEDGLPSVIETAFAWRGDQSDAKRRIITGVNWSPTIVDPFRTLGQANAAGLSAFLEERLAGPDEPIVFLLHCACPRVRYTDRGKSAVALE